MNATDSRQFADAERFAEKASLAIEIAVLESLTDTRDIRPPGLLKRIRVEMPPAKRFYIFRRDRYRCRLCGSSASDGVRIEVDHVVPVSLGGGDDQSNLWTLCFDCNRGKGAEML